MPIFVVVDDASCLLRARRYERLEGSLAFLSTPQAKPTMTLERLAATPLLTVDWLGGRASPKAARRGAAGCVQASVERGSSGRSNHALAMQAIPTQHIDVSQAPLATSSGRALVVVNTAFECGPAPGKS